jgi:hypothetical protein
MKEIEARSYVPPSKTQNDTVLSLCTGVATGSTNEGGGI